MKKALLLLLITTTLSLASLAITLGVYPEDYTVNIGNLRLNVAKVSEVSQNHMASRFIKPGDLIVSVYSIYATPNFFGGYSTIEQTNSSRFGSKTIQGTYLSFQNAVQLLNQVGITNSNELRNRLSRIGDGDMFQVLILRNGRFIEYVIH